MDAVQKANSGHPGMPMGAAPMAYALFRDHLRFDAECPNWFNRDRFILSAGHGSMLLYSLLHLTGYSLSLDEIKAFRQWGSKTPGHPENTITPGVEMATGPLGQGFATGVGMAIAEAQLSAQFPGLIDHHTYAICSDGDLMEGISHEAASLAGHLGLGKLIYLYDSNAITIDGATSLSFSEDVRLRFEAYGWHVSDCDGMSVSEVSERIGQAKAVHDKPSLIICRTVIGFGSPNKQGKSSSHGAPLGEEEVKAAKTALGIPLEPLFYIPDEVRTHMAELGKRFRDDRIASELLGSQNTEFCARAENAAADITLPQFDKPVATRAASGQIINALAERLPGLLGGSADLAESNNTLIHNSGPYSRSDRLGRNIYFGVREHAMGAALNGINLHGGLRAFGGTFLIFSDYMRPAIRLAALMHAPSIFVFTHDSIGLGEDGPTHQPIEQLSSLRAIPNLWVIRPADANETKTAWQMALGRKEGPSALVLTRQALPILSPNDDSASKGAYVLRSSGNDVAAIIATGSEVEIAVSAAVRLGEAGINVRVVSVPCWEAFDSQSDAYKESILPRSLTCRVSIEAASTHGWANFVGLNGVSIGIDHFGASAPYKTLYDQFGLTADRVVEAVKGLLTAQ